MSPTSSTTTAEPTTIDAATRGRPRDSDRTAAILDAAVDVMHDVGWDGFKVQEVANRAGCGLATIYRRWETKEDLVAAAMRHDTDEGIALVSSGDPRDALTAFLTRFGDKMCAKGGSVISVMAAARDHEAMRAAFDESVAGQIRPAITDLIDQIIGPDHPRSLTLADAIMGALIFRAGMLELDMDGAEFAAEMLALVDAVSS